MSYDITGGLVGPANTEAEKAASIMKAQFPSANNSEDGSILVVIQGTQVYSEPLKQAILALNNTLSHDSEIGNYSGEYSLYSLEYSILNSSIPAIVNQTGCLQW